MLYFVQIVEVGIDDMSSTDGGSPAFALDERFATVREAEEAGIAEVQRLLQRGIHAHFNVVDQNGDPVQAEGPTA